MPLIELTKKPVSTPLNRLNPEFKPWTHQHTLSDHSRDNEQSFWMADCGTGKSRAALMAADKSGSHLTLILTVKAALRGVWPEEIEGTFGDEVDYFILDKGNSNRKTADMITFAKGASKPSFLVVNYETARLLPLDAINWTMAIADESHRLASHNSKQSKTLAHTTYNVPHKVAMTGTPFSDRPLQVYGQARWLKPARNRNGYYYPEWFGSYGNFFDRHVNYYIPPGTNQKIPQKNNTWKNLDEMSATLAPYVVEVRKHEVHDLPSVTTITKNVKLKPKHKRAYDQLRDTGVVTVASLNGDDHQLISQNPLVLLTRLHTLTCGFYQPFDLSLDPQPLDQGDAKLLALGDLLDEIGGQPTVIFTRFKEDVTRIAQLLRKRQIGFNLLTGEEDSHMDWRKNDRPVLIANISAGSEAVNLTKASYMIYYSMGFSKTQYDQSRDRVDRPGQTRPVTIYHLLAEDTVDYTIYEALQSKGHTESILREFLNG